MKKIEMQLTSHCTMDKAFLDFQRYNTANNLSKETINYYDNCFKYFRQLF